MKYVLLAILCLPLFAAAQDAPPAKPLTWYSIEEALILNEKEPRPVMIDLYTDWCGWCKVMDQRTFSNPEIIRLLSTYFYPVKFDAEQKPEVNFKGRIFKFVPSGQRGYHELAAALTQGKLSYPTLVFLDKTMTPLQPLPGYKTPNDLEPILSFFGTGIYLTQTYDAFMKEFKSKLKIETQINGNKEIIPNNPATNVKPSINNNKEIIPNNPATNVKPPILNLVENSLIFIDENNNDAIDANEKCYLEFTLENTGYSDGVNLIAKIYPSGSTQGINLITENKLDKIVPKSGRSSFRIPIPTNHQTVQGKLTLKVNIEEPNGFNPKSFSIDIQTHPFQSPNIKVAEFELSGNGVLKSNEPFELKILIQNFGQGTAKDINLRLKLPENVKLFEGEELQKISELKPNDFQEISYKVIINSKYSNPSVPISISLSESYGKYAESWSHIFSMNQQIEATRKYVVEAKELQNVNIEPVSFKSDVDRNIPKSKSKKSKRLALVIGNENYSSRRTGLSPAVNVEFAERDASVFYQYLRQSFGIDSVNIKLITNATSGEMRSGLDWLTNLSRAIGAESELYFFYSGHGLPTDADQTPYLIPVDISGDRPEMGIALKEVYEQLSKFPAKKITVVLDACFSGGARNEELVAKKGIRVRPKEGAIPNNMVVLASSSGNQSSAVYKEKKHGFLTYFLLKGIQDMGTTVQYGALFEFVRSEVDKEAARQGKVQQPQILTPPNFEDWQTWTVQ